MTTYDKIVCSIFFGSLGVAALLIIIESCKANSFLQYLLH